MPRRRTRSIGADSDSPTGSPVANGVNRAGQPPYVHLIARDDVGLVYDAIMSAQWEVMAVGLVILLLALWVLVEAILAVVSIQRERRDASA